MARIRLNRQRLNPRPGTKSTQSRYFLGYFVFVDDPDVGYAVAVRAAAPVRTGKLMQERALEKAEAAAQKLSDQTDRAVAFMPILPQATKYEAVEHLYGGKDSRKYGGPHARKGVTLSRTRLPNRPVAQTALKSVKAHWEALYGPGAVGQAGRPRADVRFRTAAAYSTGSGSLRFRPAAVRTAEEVAKEKALAKLQKLYARKAKAENLAFGVGTPVNEQNAALLAVGRLNEQILKLESSIREAEDQAADMEGVLPEPEAEAWGLDPEVVKQVLDEAELGYGGSAQEWVNRLAFLFGTESPQELGKVAFELSDVIARAEARMKRAGYNFNVPALITLISQRGNEDLLRKLELVGVFPEYYDRAFRSTIRVLTEQGELGQDWDLEYRGRSRTA